MHIETVNGIEVRTNYRESFNGYSFSDGNGKKTMSMHLTKDCRESDTEMLERLVASGYRTITFYYTTTRVRGYYDLIAFCKR